LLQNLLDALKYNGQHPQARIEFAADKAGGETRILRAR